MSLILDNLTLRQLQHEAARALLVLPADNNSLSKFNKMAAHNSQNWYKAVIQAYIDQFNGLPSEIGPGKEVKLLYT